MDLNKFDREFFRLIGYRPPTAPVFVPKPKKRKLDRSLIAIFIFFGLPILWALFLSATQSPKELQPWQMDALRGVNPRECAVEDLQYYRCYHN